MATAEHKEPNYLGVFWALLILTLAEVGIFYLHPPHLVLVISLVAMALVKAGLVAAYFMHLRFEARTLALIVISPLLLATLMLIGLTPDARYSPPRKPPTRWVLPGQEDKEEEEKKGDEQAAPQPEQQPAAPATPTEGPAG